MDKTINLNVRQNGSDSQNHGQAFRQGNIEDGGKYDDDALGIL